MKPATREFWNAFSRIDWPRQMQRAGVFLRELRGDQHGEIHADHEREIQRGRNLRAVCEKVTRQTLGCVAPDPCTCAMCLSTTEPRP